MRFQTADTVVVFSVLFANPIIYEPGHAVLHASAWPIEAFTQP